MHHTQGWRSLIYDKKIKFSERQPCAWYMAGVRQFLSQCRGFSLVVKSQNPETLWHCAGTVPYGNPDYFDWKRTKTCSTSFFEIDRWVQPKHMEMFPRYHKGQSLDEATKNFTTHTRK